MEQGGTWLETEASDHAGRRIGRADESDGSPVAWSPREAAACAAPRTRGRRATPPAAWLHLQPGTEGGPSLTSSPPSKLPISSLLPWRRRRAPQLSYPFHLSPSPSPCAISILGRRRPETELEGAGVGGGDFDGKPERFLRRCREFLTVVVAVRSPELSARFFLGELRFLDVLCFSCSECHTLHLISISFLLDRNLISYSYT